MGANYSDQNEDINILNIDHQLDNLINNSTSSFYETFKKIISKWNKVTVCFIDGKKVIIDRSTWIAREGIYIKYVWDSIGYPL